VLFARQQFNYSIVPHGFLGRAFYTAEVVLNSLGCLRYNFSLDSITDTHHEHFSKNPDEHSDNHWDWPALWPQSSLNVASRAN
jgi:hypothetical protein